ncbi:MAG: hypothetical protein RL766_1751 [Bacteroidota bacterium]
MAKSTHFFIRRSHRYLGLLLGLQFLLWTIGGLYFSWSNMDEIHGDFQKKKVPLLKSDLALVSPSIVLDSIKKIHSVDSLVSIQLIDILGEPHYQIRCVSAIHDTLTHKHERGLMNHLAHAVTGKLREPLNQQEAVAVAARHFNGQPAIMGTEYLTTTNSHHEYREQPLPAYAVTFTHPSNTTVYVSTELGTVQKFRNDKWRIFDFLWMLHTMDYESRDEIGNVLLRIFSIFGLITILSGFSLYIISSRWWRRKFRN